MVDAEFLGPWGRFVLIGAGAAAVLVFLLIIACFLTPGCIGYECVRKRRKHETNTPLRCNGPPNENVKLADVSYRSWRLGSLYDNGSICENVESQGRDSPNSINGTFESIETASTLSLINVEKQPKDDPLKDFPTELTMSLQYLPASAENVTGKLVIGIEAVSNLPQKQYNCTLEPYVAVNIVKQSWSNRNPEKLHSFRTRGVRHTASPIYRETFVVADVKPQEVKEWAVDVTAYDHDRYANHTELCTLRVPLKEVKKLLTSPEIHLLNYKMKRSSKEFGNILLGISYLPTAQRLTINVARLANVKFAPTVPTLNDFNPYVRILMLNGKTGRKMKKKKTKFLRAAAQPEFNETLTFDLTFAQLETIQFLVAVWSKNIIAEENSSGQHSDSEESINSYKKSKDVCIGKVAIGKGARGATEKAHWFAVLQNPRKIVTVWHTLK
ncbi:synaptotagmin-2-like isoform X1 [Neodiprion fabricii]|uniref:synaptotagmin-2-like isoform X1 n=1 Tax=Neodiprion fabricii TaxID=2872261 RepID=UPI001ED931C2|nr:synaptotagmin-2-like isoform X1 [Neodiprion fabricii]XP_046420083.1 synaptotagmin-2-like isoform X1 [Neodiprion fabricii]XP_046420084.1 synaptotagmin-2-like isoform X1 [Neodiprion fabricii]XP_046420086.1 synaptotagmin-2-like isoform X1 [Neodiprion fabricii]